MYYVYIMTNKANAVLYTGMTNDLMRRTKEHANKEGGAFTKRYNVCKLVYFERFEKVMDAIVREKQIKGWLRCKKVELIQSANPKWYNLGENLYSNP